MLLFVKSILIPFAYLYGGIVEIVKIAYRWGLRRVFHFSDIFVLKVGNLSVGGTGKTPHTIYIVSLLQTLFPLAVISRGYGRQTRQTFLATQAHLIIDIGDEPALMTRVLSVPIILANQRVEGVELLRKQFPNLHLCVLDDAMQHWSLASHKSILLTTYQQPFFEDYPLPSGRLREFAFNYKRADILIVTKCPAFISENEQDSFRKRFRLGLHQQLFFSWYEYGQPYAFLDAQQTLDLEILKTSAALVITGIADTEYLEIFLQQHTQHYELLKYPDHHPYSLADLERIQQKFVQLQPKATFILTTEKDAMRLELQKSFILQQNLPIFCLPIRVAMHAAQQTQFQHTLINWITPFYKNTL